ncbi:MAG: glycoside hydrolase family 2 TIM barrel-domain containing protein [Kiritimatiellia bacterium]
MMRMGLLWAVAGLSAGVAIGELKPKAYEMPVSTNDWENLAVNSRNRLPARTYCFPLASVEAALEKGVLPDSPYRMSLDGVWKIRWAGDPARRATGFWEEGFDVASWEDIDVPSCVELRGFGAPGYTNHQYPHANRWPLVRDRQNPERADYNPVSSYVRSFDLPEGWEKRDVFLRFDGVYSAYYVWVNGKMVGYAEDSKLPSEFDVTSFVRPGKNRIAVQVYRWCDGSYLEDQDMFRYSGIFRSVTLWSREKGGIWDFAVKTALTNDYRDATLEVVCDKPADITLYDGQKPILKGKSGQRYELKGVKLWSAETPNLYTLVVQSGRDIRARKVGFKEQKIVGHVFYVNGRPIKLKGVNRHECSPENGRTVSLKEMMLDIELFKRHNINTVRTCHYPDSPIWYDLCDRYGIYVVAEANVEAHEPGYGENGLGLYPQWRDSIVERNRRHAEFYRNNVCVTLWSLGNETGHGQNFRDARDAVRHADPSRPIHWERGNKDADVDSTMYPSVEWVINRGKLGDGLLRQEGPVKGAFGVGDDQFARKPAFLCEYAHAMGNAIGNFQEYWDAFYAYESLMGGCIWDWVDQSVWKDTDRLDPKTGRRERYLAYGGDFDEAPHSGAFCDNGVVDPLRTVTPKLLEVAHVHRNLIVRRDGEGFELENRYGFTSSDAFDGHWQLLADGAVVAKGDFAVPAVEPLKRGKLVVPALAQAMAKLDGREWVVNFSFTTRGAGFDGLVPAGWTVARDEIALTDPVAPPALQAAAPGAVSIVQEGDGSVVVKGPKVLACFSRKSGTLSKLVLDGVTVLEELDGGLAAGPRLTCLRAPADNDRWWWQGDPWCWRDVASVKRSGLVQARYHVLDLSVSGNSVKAVVDVTGAKGIGFVHESVWTFGAGGRIEVANKVVPYGKFPPAIPRLGLSWKLSPALEQMAYYGRGPHENYVDRRRSAFLGVYRSTVSEQFVDYVRPQDNGYKSDVRWVSFTDKDGRGVRFASATPLFVQALHYPWEELATARHDGGEARYRWPLRPAKEVYLNLDVRQLGLGGASCGPVPMDCYRFNPEAPVEWSFTLEPARAK